MRHRGPNFLCGVWQQLWIATLFSVVIICLRVNVQRRRGGEGIVHSSTRHRQFGQRRQQRSQGFPAKEHRNELGHPFYTDEWSEGFGPQTHERNGVRERPVLSNI